jgi:hypothetical protein
VHQGTTQSYSARSMSARSEEWTLGKWEASGMKSPVILSERSFNRQPDDPAHSKLRRAA